MRGILLVLVVTPDRTDLLDPTPGPTLTLVTCYPFHWIGPAPDRFIVRASELRHEPLGSGVHAWNAHARGSDRMVAEKRTSRRSRGHARSHAREPHAPATGYVTKLRWS